MRIFRSVLAVALVFGGMGLSANIADAAWVDDFDNGDPLTNSTSIGWTNPYVNPALGTKPNLPINDTDPSDDYSFLSEAGRLPGAVNLRTSAVGTVLGGGVQSVGWLGLATASPLPELDFLSPGAETRLQIKDWNSGPVNNGVFGNGASYCNTFGTIAASGSGTVGGSDDEIWFRQDHSNPATSITFFNKINGLNFFAPGTRTDFYGTTTDTGTIPYLTDDAGDFVYPSNFAGTTNPTADSGLLMLNFDVELDPTTVSATVWTVHPTNGRTYSSNLTWAHGFTLADWDAGSAGSYIGFSPYAALEDYPDCSSHPTLCDDRYPDGLIRGTDLSIGKIIAGIQTVLGGDFNEDGSVDAADYVAWRKGLGTVYNQTHYSLWRANFGMTSGSGADSQTTAAVPEPNLGVLSIGALIASVLCRRRVGL